MVNERGARAGSSRNRGGRHYPGIPGRNHPVTDGRLRRNRHILDPFAGSSTTGIAAAMIGERDFTGIEKDKKFIDLSIKRHRDLIKTPMSTWSAPLPIAV